MLHYLEAVAEGEAAGKASGREERRGGGGGEGGGGGAGSRVFELAEMRRPGEREPGSELTDNVVVMRFGIIDNAGRLAEVIMIEQRCQQQGDRDQHVSPHGQPRKSRHEEEKPTSDR
jgi:hypothetical protein